MSEMDNTRTRLEELIARCDEILAVLDERGDQLVRDNVRRTAGTLMLADELHDQLATAHSAIVQRLVAQTRRVLSLQKSMADSLGDPDLLREASSAVGSAVSAASTVLADDVRSSSLGAMNNDDVWNGPGAELYARTLDGQSEAVRSIAGVSDEMAALFVQLAETIESYYATLEKTVAGLYGALVAMASAVASGATGVVALRGIASSVSSLIDSLVNHVVSTGEKSAAIEQRLRALNADVGDWPRRSV